ncbi:MULTISPECIES: hypothetical protein [unclassified Nostoc]|nr:MULTISPECIES: hypothetical protein [unclassified Nostoc]
MLAVQGHSPPDYSTDPAADISSIGGDGSRFGEVIGVSCTR